jgi:hypothetical protein
MKSNRQSAKAVMPRLHDSQLEMGENPMATDAFLLLDCIGLVFLIYALVNFWNEWQHCSKDRHSNIRVHLDERNLGGRIAIIPRVFIFPKDQNSVIPFPARYRQIHLPSESHVGFAKTIEMHPRVISESRASQRGK